ncbi:subtilisin-like protein, partial [Mycena galericulata]
MFAVAYLVAVALTFVSAKPVADTMVLHERRDVVPAGFVQSGPAPGSQVLNLSINLASNDLAGLENALNAAAAPTSSSYGQWLSKEQVEAFARPSDETTAAVSQWLSDNGIESTPKSAAGDWISISVTAAQANELLKADFSVFTHIASGQQSIRTLEYSIPASLQNHVRILTPTTSFNGPRRTGPTFAKSNSVVPRGPTPVASAASCSSTITPTCLQSMYKIPTTPATNKTNVIGVAGFDDQFANKADLTQFLKAERPDIASTTSFTLTSVDSGTNSQTLSQAGVEADLDIQYTVGLATGVPVTFVSVGETNKDGADDGFLDIITALIAETAPPQVLTTSYGFDTEASLSESLTVAMCNSYMQLTARGVSILFASGDDNGLNDLSVTLVGATSGSPETGASLSAGGFSNYFPQQTWRDVVNAYIKSIGTEYAGLYNTTGRGYPDVSAAGENVLIVQDAESGLVAGTSLLQSDLCVCHRIAERPALNAGKPVLGFLNPWLYANPQAFNDITTGSQPRVWNV